MDLALWICLFFFCVHASSGLKLQNEEQGHRHLKTAETLKAQEDDRIFKLPGQPDVSFAQYSGYVTVNETGGRALFYWLVEAQKDAQKKPLVLWLNGGPGCSSIGYGAAEEIGPFHILDNGTGLSHNPYSWNKVANLLFLESPAGVGFSYSNSSYDLSSPGDKSTAKDNYLFLERWMERFTQYKYRDFYITGESYAGNYVPQLAQLIYRKNKRQARPSINLKGFMVGNAVIDNYEDNLGRFDYWWTHALISDNTHQSLVKSCSNENHADLRQCYTTMRYALSNEIGEIDRYNIYAPVCHVSLSSRSKFYYRDPRHAYLLGYDPCIDNYAEEYFNRIDVQKALHANITKLSYKWTGCSDTINGNWKDSASSVLHIYRELINAGLRIWVYSGDIDSILPVTSTRYSLRKLNLTTSVPWFPWYRKNEVGGYTQIYKGLTFVTVRNAGHEVPLFQPGRALTLVENFLMGKQMPKEK